MKPAKATWYARHEISNEEVLDPDKVGLRPMTANERRSFDIYYNHWELKKPEESPRERPTTNQNPWWLNTADLTGDPEWLNIRKRSLAINHGLRPYVALYKSPDKIAEEQRYKSYYQRAINLHDQHRKELNGLKHQDRISALADRVDASHTDNFSNIIYQEWTDTRMIMPAHFQYFCAVFICLLSMLFMVPGPTLFTTVALLCAWIGNVTIKAQQAKERADDLQLYLNHHREKELLERAHISIPDFQERQKYNHYRRTVSQKLTEEDCDKIMGIRLEWIQNNLT
ncbi:hypothetical protein EDC01DRAFT_636282 [Geopyxis carbonaria]|nr:hypothetical protein EDC01DRAFT_636282 [Geopyxis carbonaria]